MKSFFKIHLLFLILLSASYYSFSQNTKSNSIIEKLFLEGNKYFESNDYNQAKVKYQEVISIDSTYVDALYNLAATELNLKNQPEACLLLRKGYSLGDIKTRELIQKFCGGITYQEYMFIQDVDELPKFYYKGEITPLLVNGNRSINPKLVELFQVSYKKSKILKKAKIKDKVYLQFIIGKDGSFNCKIKQELDQELKDEIMATFNSMTTYLPAKFGGKDVGLINGHFALPIIF